MFLKGKRDYQGCFPAEHPPWAQCIETHFCLPLDTSDLPAPVKCSGYFQILSCCCCNLCFSALILLICFLLRVNRDQFWEQSYGYSSEDIEIFSVGGRNMSNSRPGNSFSLWEARKMDYMVFMSEIFPMCVSFTWTTFSQQMQPSCPSWLQGYLYYSTSLCLSLQLSCISFTVQSGRYLNTAKLTLSFLWFNF